MNTRTYRMAAPLAFTVAVVALGLTVAAAWLSAQPQPGKLCCIAGVYRGSQTPDPLPNCPVPKAELFSMTISQAPGCGADVWGTITSASGKVNQFKGTLRPGSRGCCVIEASFSEPKRPGHLVTFKGNFCQQMGKWHASGVFTEVNSGDPCKKGGVWKIDQN